MDANKPVASRERLLSMHEIAPEPIAETPADTATPREYFGPSSSSPNHYSSCSSALGLSGHNAAWWLHRIQRYSSYAFTPFLAAHILNTSVIPLVTRSLPASDTYLLLTRPYYQSALFEPALVLAPLALHVGAGVALRLYRRRQSVHWYGAESRDDRRRLAWPKLSGTGALGYALLPLVASHAFVNRVLPLWVEGGSSSVGLQYVAHRFSKHPAATSVVYAVLIGAASWHVVWGWATWLGLSPDAVVTNDAARRGFARKRRWYRVNGLAAFLAGVWMAGGLGVIGRGGATGGWMGKAFDELYSKIPLVVKWM